MGSAGSHPGGLLFKEEPTQWAKQFVHVVQLLHFIPLRSRQWPRGLSRLRELLQLLNPRDSVSEWGARCGSKALAPCPKIWYLEEDTIICLPQEILHTVFVLRQGLQVAS